MDGKITVFCPNCHKRLMEVDRKSKADNKIICKKCRKLIVFKIDSHEVEVKPIPQRTCSS